MFGCLSDDFNTSDNRIACFIIADKILKTDPAKLD